MGGGAEFRRASPTHPRHIRIDLVHGDVPRVVVPLVRVAHRGLEKSLLRGEEKKEGLGFSPGRVSRSLDGSKRAEGGRRKGEYISKAEGVGF